MVDGVLIQCLSVVCRTLSTFLLSVCTYVCVVYGFNLYISLVVCWLFLKWYVDSREVLFHIYFHLVMCVDCLVIGRHTVCGICCW